MGNTLPNVNNFITYYLHENQGRKPISEKNVRYSIFTFNRLDVRIYCTLTS